jgi:hypothetical protein
LFCKPLFDLFQDSRPSDAGQYECQVSYHDDVEKKLKKPIKLFVLGKSSVVVVVVAVVAVVATAADVDDTVERQLKKPIKQFGLCVSLGVVVVVMLMMLFK